MAKNIITRARERIESVLENNAAIRGAGIVLRKWDSDKQQRVDNPAGDLARWLRVDPDSLQPQAFEYNDLIRVVYTLQVAIVAPKGKGLKAELIEWMGLAVFVALQPLTRQFADDIDAEKCDVTGGEFAIVDSSVKDKQATTSDLLWSNLCRIEVTLDVSPDDLATYLGDAPQ